MTAAIIRTTAHDGSTVEFYDQLRGSGGLKDCYFSVDGRYVVLFFRQPPDANVRERIANIVGRFRDGIFNQVGGEYWSGMFCWPQRTLEWNGRFGLVAPMYARHFFFEHGSRNGDVLQIAGREKEGKWFASANNRSKYLDPRELGNWASHLRICLLIARAVRRLHMAGLAHSDLSYKNVLVDPVGGNACIIDIDGLVVPGKYPPDVVGTPDFIAPEVVATAGLPKHDPQRRLPSIQTDLHALATLIYMYLLYRHPLRGGKVHDADATRDEELAMGERALFVEDPHDASNRVRLSDVRSSELPWADAATRPYTLTGPYLAPLFLRAFTTGLRDPQQRPQASEWEDALVRTVDLLQPCSNARCEQGWYVFDNTSRPRCPFCATPYPNALPVLDLYFSTHTPGQFRPENHRLVVYTGQSLFPWHVNRHVAPNEKLAVEQRRRVGYFVLHEGHWYLVNEAMPELYDATAGALVPIGEKVELSQGRQLLLSRAEGGRLVHVQLVLPDAASGAVAVD
ncbi:helix-hairpin-helix domain-containing protein [Xanthomonas floridensis]|uniref:Kinase n=1 Tax=Xanthomonas floridensis TaxID=1843580 RepID=A0A1A9MHA3_9XANT|nr:kinase [Xanthomonas floridensis]MEA5124101.1 kinase [Xanthomonas floridensis]MEA5132026.1 kinase [Xanthomonas floridensis]OAG68990.1 kinase [Xanthomonas floridensis]